MGCVFIYFKKCPIYAKNISIFLNHIYNINISLILAYIYNTNINFEI